ncbi:MAG: thiamine pyrophosphate-dependent enzyme [Flavobacteriales bacterium]|nr:thiamine pyrophosphate-dependent enzyme [Flavobacteriales bacterium]MCX7767813.1 thiamine pyrophosphate-dependent enzyme [Flavobacteriales bacterium]MDW8409786.1 thiamine pyrophosphate-dependent enzyme [Flavobacteriales bacterium]
MDEHRHLDMQALALRVREHILRMSTGGGCFTGASLSCADIIVYLYASGRFRLGPAYINDPDRDRVFLSKGHDVPALYATLAELGFFPVERLKNHLHPLDHLYWHPNRQVPGVEFFSGSLGHLPAVGLGVAYHLKLKGSKSHVIVVVGDGELNEGSVWECLLVASAYRMDNLIFVVDRNAFQANMRTEELIPLEPLEDKWKAFGCHVVRVNGHDFTDLDRGFSELEKVTGRPKAIICDTVRGKGVPSLQERADRWFCNFTAEEVEDLIKELRGHAAAQLRTPGDVVR